MVSENTQLVLQTAKLSALAGMRSMSGPALLTLNHKLMGSSRLLDSPYVRVGIQVLAAGEMFADKLPFVPKRTWFPALLARTASGALVGARMFNSKRKSEISGAIIGGATAIAAAYVSYHVRRTLTKTFHVPDFVIALAEDAIVVSGAMDALS